MVKAFSLTGDRRNLDANGELAVDHSGWVVLRAWNDGADPQVLDIYPYATTSPVYLELPARLAADREDAAYFVAWLDRAIADAAARKDFRTDAERAEVLNYLRSAREVYRRKGNVGSMPATSAAAGGLRSSTGTLDQERSALDIARR